MSSNRKAKLMDIPYELRVKIYMDVFVEAEVFVYRHNDSEYESRPAGSAAAESSQGRFCAENMNIRVLGISSQIHREALPLLQKAIHLVVNDTKVNVDDFPSTLRNCLPRIEQLTLRITSDQHYHGFVASYLPKLKLLTVGDNHIGRHTSTVILSNNSALEECIDNMIGGHDEGYVEAWFKNSRHPKPDYLSWLNTLLTSLPVHVQVPELSSNNKVATIHMVFDFKTQTVLSRSVQGQTIQPNGVHEYAWVGGGTKKQVREWLRDPWYKPNWQSSDDSDGESTLSM